MTAIEATETVATEDVQDRPATENEVDAATRATLTLPAATIGTVSAKTDTDATIEAGIVIEATGIEAIDADVTTTIEEVDAATEIFSTATDEVAGEIEAAEKGEDAKTDETGTNSLHKLEARRRILHHRGNASLHLT